MAEELEKIIGHNIMTLRKQREMTQEALGDELGYTFQAVSRWENAKSLPNPVTLKRIADFFEVPIEYMYETHEQVVSTEKENVVKRKELRFRIALIVLMTFFSLGTVGMIIGCLKMNAASGFFWVALGFSVIALAVTYIFDLKRFRLLALSMIIWSAANSIFYQFDGGTNTLFMVYFYALFGQIFVVLLNSFNKRH